MRSSRILGLVAAAAIGLSAPAAAQSASYEQLQTFSALLNQIRLNYVDSVSTAALVHAAITGMLRSLDPHSHFETRAEIEREMRWNTGQLGGAGLALDDIAGEVTVAGVYAGSAADRAGIVAGDRVRTLNDTLVVGLGARAVQARLLGDKGARLRLGLARGSRLEPDTFGVTLKFALLVPRAVTDARMLDPATAYVRFSEFSLKSGTEVESAIRRLLTQDHARRLVFDLRGNPGGFMGGATELAGAFLPKGALVFSVQGRRPGLVEQRTDAPGEFMALPLVLLVDEGTASAAEALAGSLQDHDRAVLVGRRTFGKALMQQMLPVPPSGDVVWLTVGYVVTPSGRTIQRRYKGIGAEQYESFGGRSGAGVDTTTPFRTDRGRLVRGGGGIAPDVPLPPTVAAPAWWSAAADSGFDLLVADSVAATLPATPAARAAWVTDSARWRVALTAPFLQRVRTRLGVAAATTPALDAAIARRLAARAAEVRWGADARDDLLIRSDAEIGAAVAAFARLESTLAPH